MLNNMLMEAIVIGRSLRRGGRAPREDEPEAPPRDAQERRPCGAPERAGFPLNIGPFSVDSASGAVIHCGGSGFPGRPWGAP